jgi:NADPH-dependent curcumin reductase CurA
MDLAAIINKQWIYTARPTAEVTANNYQLVTAPLTKQELAPGELLVQAHYISVDPYMRIQQAAQDSWEAPHPLGAVQGAGVVAKVLAVKGDTGEIAVGDFVNCYTGWQMYAICAASAVRKLDPTLPLSTALGVLGMPGRTAYFGLHTVGRPQVGETVLVSGAAGAVGSIVAQLAKLQGCRVVGIVGSAAKQQLLQEEFNLDATINYKDHPTLAAMTLALKTACPQGIDVYFDNVGGPITDAAMTWLNLRARVIICGQISQYNGGLDNPELGPRFLHHILYKRALIQGILARDFADRMPEMLAALAPLVRSGQLRYPETIITGFENLPATLNALFYGNNTGKMIVKVSP